MKKSLFITITFFTFQIVSAQETINDSNNLIYNLAGIEKKPECPGGIKEFLKFIRINYNTPPEEDGRNVFLTFIIEKDGSLTNFNIPRVPDFASEEEAKRVLSICPKWIAGEKNGEKVRTIYSVPISKEIP